MLIQRRIVTASLAVMAALVTMLTVAQISPSSVLSAVANRNVVGGSASSNVPSEASGNATAIRDLPVGEGRDTTAEFLTMSQATMPTGALSDTPEVVVPANATPLRAEDGVPGATWTIEINSNFTDFATHYRQFLLDQGWAVIERGDGSVNGGIALFTVANAVSWTNVRLTIQVPFDTPVEDVAALLEGTTPPYLVLISYDTRPGPPPFSTELDEHYEVPAT